ncbi:MAG: DUF3267 domain-containing protein [Halobacteriota archaeon]|uniref:DUF3267 domain-containing protein n=1 Tax=Natronomonas sp. TaxID=2184060 RepID=UPI003976DF20
MSPDPKTAGPPPTPEGYDDHDPFEHSTVLLLVLSVPIGILAFAGFGWILWGVQSPEVFFRGVGVTETAEAITVALDLVAVLVSFVVALAVVVVVHELIHGAVMRQYGKDVTYGVHLAMGAFYTAAFGQFQAVEELVPIAIAPLLLIALVGTPLLFVPVPIVALTVYLILASNAAGAVGDLYVVRRLRRLPDGTLLYDADLHHWCVFEPATRSEKGGPDQFESVGA